MPKNKGHVKNNFLTRTALILNYVGVKVSDLLVVHEKSILILFIIFYSLIHISLSRRRLWYDELFTFFIARLPDLNQLIKALPADGNPPLYHLLAHFAMRVAGETEVAVRLPAVLGIILALISVYFFVRRHFGPVFALFGMLALACSPVALTYGSEARPYALMLGFTGVTLVSWQAATVESLRRRRLPLLGVAVGIAGAVASHHYGIVHVGLPLAFGEAVRLVKRKRLDWPLYLACLAGLSAVSLTYPFVIASRQVMLDYVKNSGTFWAKPSILNLRSYYSMLCWWLPLLFFTLTIVFKSLPCKNEAIDIQLPAGHEIAAVFGLASIVPFIIGITWLTTGYYLTRYAIGTSLGISIILVYSVIYLVKNHRQAAMVAGLCIAIMTVNLAAPLSAVAMRKLQRKYVGQPAQNNTVRSIYEAAPADLPIVIASALTYFPMKWYAPPFLRERLHYLADLQYAVKQPDFLPELSMTINQNLFPVKVDNYRTFIEGNKRFVLYCTGEPRLEWVKQRLLDEGWKLELIEKQGVEELYLATRPGN